MDEMTTTETIERLAELLASMERQRDQAADLIGHATEAVDRQIAQAVDQAYPVLEQRLEADRDAISQKLRAWGEAAVAEFEAGKDDWRATMSAKVDEAVEAVSGVVEKRIRSFVAEHERLIASSRAALSKEQRRFALGTAIANERVDLLAMGIEREAGQEVWKLVANAVDQLDPLLDAITRASTARSDLEAAAASSAERLSAAAARADEQASGIDEKVEAAAARARSEVDSITAASKEMQRNALSVLDQIKAEQADVRAEMERIRAEKTELEEELARVRAEQTELLAQPASPVLRRAAPRSRNGRGPLAPDEV